jgi:hypothetical protein
MMSVLKKTGLSQHIDVYDTVKERFISYHHMVWIYICYGHAISNYLIRTIKTHVLCEDT